MLGTSERWFQTETPARVCGALWQRLAQTSRRLPPDSSAVEAEVATTTGGEPGQTPLIARRSLCGARQRKKGVPNPRTAHGTSAKRHERTAPAGTPFREAVEVPLRSFKNPKIQVGSFP